MRRVIKTTKAPAPIGPYNQAIEFNDTLYISGQIALDAATGEWINSTISAETEKVMQNLGAVLEAAGYRFEDIVKCSIFIKNMDEFQAINNVYATYFNEDLAPARETVQVARLPKDVNVEISAIACKA